MHMGLVTIIEFIELTKPREFTELTELTVFTELVELERLAELTKLTKLAHNVTSMHHVWLKTKRANIKVIVILSPI